MKKSKLFAAQFLILMLCIAAHADVPKQMNYQGVLSGSTGNPLADSTVDVEFRIYNAPAGGNSVWAETLSVTTDDEGRFKVILGQINPIEDTVFRETERYLSINVEASGDIVPRTKITSAGYANRVSTVDGATGGIISGNTSIQSDLAVSGKATIGPGHTNTGAYAFVAGENNSATADYATVGGGESNVAGDFHATVGGGLQNRSIGNGSTVGGGSGNYARDNFSTVGGGAFDTATANYATVGGGVDNTASGLHATVGGGAQNIASSEGATVAGGRLNSASAMFYATVGGGSSNIASGNYATVPGGDRCEATGQTSFAAGALAQAIHNRAFVWSDGSTGLPFASTAPNQFLILAAGGVGIGTASPAAELDVAGDFKVSGDIIGSIPWTTFPFAAGYDNYVDAHGSGFQAVQYRKIGDMVYLRGNVHKADHVAVANGAILGTLPAGFRPPATVRFTPDPNGNSVDVTSSGAVISYGPGTTADYQFLDGISFSTTP